jgi:hypothetical protein
LFSIFFVGDDLAPIPYGLIETAEADSWEEIQRDIRPEFQERFGITVRRIGGAVVVVAPRSDMLAINRVWLPGSGSDAVAEVLDEVVHHARALGTARIVAHCPTWAASSETFLTRGFRAVSPMTKLYRRATTDLDVSSPFRIEAIGTRDRELFGQIAAIGNEAPPFMAAGFDSTVGNPGWWHYLAFDGDLPIAAAGLRIYQDVAWCCFAGTVPSHRRRGAQAALLARRVRDAATADCRWVTCESVSKSPDEPSQSLRNMQRLGFEVAYDRPSFVIDLSSTHANVPTA